MRNLLFLILCSFSANALASDDITQICQTELAAQKPQPSYGNTDEANHERFEPGPDEVEERNPDEKSANDPGDF